MRADHLVAGEELRLRHQAAAARQAARARRHLRVRPADRRHRRRHPAGSAGRHARRAEDRRPGGRPPGRPQPRRGERASLDDPVLLALADVKRNFPVPMEAFGELIDGCVADVRGTRYETFEDLHHYCRCVAGSIGRLSLGIFGTGPDHTGHDQQEAARPGRLARRRPAADQHPARHPRGPRERAGLPARRGPGQVRRRPGRTRARLSSPAGGVRGRTGPRLVRHRLAAAARCSTAAARPAPAPWPASTAGCSSGSRRSPPPSWTAGFLCPRGRKPWSRCAPWRGGSDEFEGRGDRRGTGRDHRRDRARRDGRRRHPARGQAPARRRDLLVQPGRPDRRHRPAHLPRLLHGLPRPAGPARHDRARHAAGPVRRDRPAPREG